MCFKCALHTLTKWLCLSPPVLHFLNLFDWTICFLSPSAFFAAMKWTFFFEKRTQLPLAFMKRGLFVPFAPAFTHSCNISLLWGCWLTYHCGIYWHIESKCFLFFFFSCLRRRLIWVWIECLDHTVEWPCVPRALLSSWVPVRSWHLLRTAIEILAFFCLILLPCSSCPKTSTNSLLLFMHLQIWNHLRLFSSAAHTSLCPRTWARPVSRLAQVGHMFAGSARVSGWKPARREAEPGQATVWFDR